MSIVRLASRPRTLRDGNGSFDAALDGMGETTIESGVDGLSENPSDDDEDAGLIGCSSGTSCGGVRLLRWLWCAWHRSTFGTGACEWCNSRIATDVGE